MKSAKSKDNKKEQFWIGALITKKLTREFPNIQVEAASQAPLPALPVIADDGFENLLKGSKND